MKKLTAPLCVILTAILFLSFVAGAETPRPGQNLIEEMVVYYAAYGAQAKGVVDGHLTRLKTEDPEAGEKWEKIMALW